MTQREAFKAGFMLACADMGLDGKAAASLVQKAATFLGTAGALAAVAPVVAPIAVGAGAGLAAYGASRPLEDVDDIKTQELIAELKRQAERVKQRQNTQLLFSQDRP